MAYKTTTEMLREMTPEQRKKVLERLQQYEKEDQITVVRDGIPLTLPVSLYKKMISKQEG